MGLELKVEESNFRDLKRIELDYDSIEFTNRLGIEVDSTELSDFMGNVEGIGQIETLSINFSSQLKDLEVVRAFPNLRNIAVYGYQITSLDGMGGFQQGEYIKISTESKNRRRRIAQISQAPIKRMSLQFARPEDLDAIGECVTLNSLDLFRSMDLDFSKWKRVPLESLGLMQGKFKELGNTAQVESLSNMRVLGCRNLEWFTGDNSRITRMVIEGCKKLDLRTLQSFQNIEALIVNGNSNKVALNEIGELKQLKSLWLIDCNVQVDISNLKHQFSRLEELQISNMKNEQVLELSQLNTGVIVSGRTYTLKGSLRTYKALNGSLIE
ncbi:hypothetical protein GC098_10275 [Paenibacillus sp. LMG 31458]|uniref:Leucine-rich repeat domain-containing protein n=1 Tax=Paenibacillus phytorum TaxID=2654977 RepID=A0ABX1XTH7_9BACL|nr:hypothetical protein [Paenibacillus phytorum]